LEGAVITLSGNTGRIAQQSDRSRARFDEKTIKMHRWIIVDRLSLQTIADRKQLVVKAGF
jgi:hypothetical protein